MYDSVCILCSVDERKQTGREQNGAGGVYQGMSKMALIAALFCAAAAQAADGLLLKIEVGDFAPEIKAKIEMAVAPFIGRSMSRDVMREILAAVLPIEKQMGIAEQRDPLTGNSTLKLMKTPAPQRIGLDLTTAFPPDSSQRRITVPQADMQANLIQQPDPVYPALGKQVRIQGTVKFAILISTEGNIQGVVLMSGHPLLVQAALEAIRQTTFRPMLLNGEPVQVVTTADVNFVLPH
jgi:TonB family protein